MDGKLSASSGIGLGVAKILVPNSDGQHVGPAVSSTKPVAAMPQTSEPKDYYQPQDIDDAFPSLDILRRRLLRAIENEIKKPHKTAPVENQAPQPQASDLQKENSQAVVPKVGESAPE